jgi:hypothetical protein
MDGTGINDRVNGVCFRIRALSLSDENNKKVQYQHAEKNLHIPIIFTPNVLIMRSAAKGIAYRFRYKCRFSILPSI